jgi:hypothetical protein
MKDILATGDASSTQKTTSSTSKHEFFFFLCVTFALLDLDLTPSADPDMGPADQNHGTDPDPQHTAGLAVTKNSYPAFYHWKCKFFSFFFV